MSYMSDMPERYTTWTTGATRRYTAGVSRWCVILLMCCLAVAVPLAATPWVGHNLGGVRVFVHPQEEHLAHVVGAMAAQEMPRIAAVLDIALPRPFPVYAYASHLDFMRDTGIDPDLRGLSTSSTGEIQLDASLPPDEVQRTLAHELTHSLLDQRLGDNAGSLPTWVNEGIAGHLSEPVSPRELPRIARLLHQRGVLTLDGMEEAFALRNDRTGAAYLQSRSMTAWLVLHYPHALPSILADIHDGAEFDHALYAATGLAPLDWLEQWQHQIPAYVYWLSLLTSPLVYAPLAFLALWAALSRLRRKQEEEEEVNADEETDEDEDI